MFALAIVGSILLAALIFRILRRSRETKFACGPFHPCLNAWTKGETKPASK